MDRAARLNQLSYNLLELTAEAYRACCISHKNIKRVLVTYHIGGLFIVPIYERKRSFIRNTKIACFLA